MQLTEHFSTEELTASSTAQRFSIDNTQPAEILPRLNVLAHGLEIVRTLLGDHPLHIDSGYRCPELNAAVKGARDSAHMKGYAADFTCADYGTPLDIVQTLAHSDVQFDQIIQEGTWVHISFDPQLRREILTAHFGADGTTYSKGV